MPRMDNSHALMEAEFDYTFDSDNPGMTDPVDLCRSCARHWVTLGVDDEVEHPPYDEQYPPYTCRGCGAELDEYDD